MATKKRDNKKYNRTVFQSLTMISQFGINMIVPIVLCSLAGYYLDKRLGTSCLVIILFFVGALAGFRNIYLFAQKIFRQPPQTKNRGIDHVEETGSDE